MFGSILSIFYSQNSGEKQILNFEDFAKCVFIFAELSDVALAFLRITDLTVWCDDAKGFSL